MSFPKWFYTRPAGFALFLMALLMVDANYLLLRQGAATGAAGVLVLLVLLACGVAAGALLLTLWLYDFEEPHDYGEARRLRWSTYVFQIAVAWSGRVWLHRGEWVGALIAMLCLLLVSWMAARGSAPKPGERLRGEPKRQAYLIVTLDLTQDPPVAVRANIYSCAASGLTTVTQKELNLDLISASGDSYDEAVHYLRRDAPLWFPRLIPLLRKSGELD